PARPGRRARRRHRGQAGRERRSGAQPGRAAGGPPGPAPAPRTQRWGPPNPSTIERMATGGPQDTPNPNPNKFTPNAKLAASMNLGSAEAAAGNAFAEAVFKIDGVVQVFGVNDFVTVTRAPGADWAVIIDGVTQAAAEHL